MTRTTHTFATMEVSAETYEEIAAKLREADYDHAFLEEGELGVVLDMHGIALNRGGARIAQFTAGDPGEPVLWEGGDPEVLVRRLPPDPLALRISVGRALSSNVGGPNTYLVFRGDPALAIAVLGQVTRLLSKLYNTGALRREVPDGPQA